VGTRLLIRPDVAFDLHGASVVRAGVGLLPIHRPMSDPHLHEADPDPVQYGGGSQEDQLALQSLLQSMPLLRWLAPLFVACFAIQY
jgi:hypothetical protein